MADKNPKEIQELMRIVPKQLEAGLKLRKGRMDQVQIIEDLYYNKTIELGDNRINVPFPIVSGFVDSLLSKIDNPPNLGFILPNRKKVSEKIDSAWKMDSSSMRGGWNRKDREEKKFACFSGRGIASIFASSVDNKYKSHYNVVDHFSFVCEGTRGHLEDQLYCGQIDVWETKAEIEAQGLSGFYDDTQVQKLIANESSEEKSEEEQTYRFDRMKALGLSPEQNAYVGQQVYNLAQWFTIYNGVRYHVIFDMKTNIWLKCCPLKEVLGNNYWPYVTWATGGGNSSVFWDKGPVDDVVPVAEAMKIILNISLNNAQRRGRPMRIVKGGAFPDVNELSDYIPDNVIVTNPGKRPEIITVETPEFSSSIDLSTYLNNFINEKTGVVGTGVDEKDAKVGVFYGQLQQEADRIGIINKSYSESYAEKGYRYFWGLKEHLTESKSIEMLGKGGVKWDELTKTELSDVDDVDDIIVSGGSREDQSNAVAMKQKAVALSGLTNNPKYAEQISARWVVKTELKNAGYNEDEIQAALDIDGAANSELMNEADQAIQEILLGRQPKLNRGANTAFMQRILDYTIDNMDYIKIDKNGVETGIDKKMKKLHDNLIKYMEKHQEITISNQQRDLRKMKIESQVEESPSGKGIDVPEQTTDEKRTSLARPFESGAPQGTPEGTASQSQELSRLAS